MKARLRDIADADVIAAYEMFGNVHRAAERLGEGITGQAVHYRLRAIGYATKPVRVWTADEEQRLDREYLLYRNAGKLDVLAAAMGRTKAFICRKAKSRGLTDPKHARPWGARWKYLDATAVATMWAHFKDSSLGLGAYCRRHGYDELGFSRTMKQHYADEWDHVIELKSPKSSMYRLGRALEYSVRNHLQSLGYFAMRSAGSRSPIDIIGVRTGVVLFVQCKRGGYLGVEEWNTLFDLATSVDAVPVLAWRKTSHTLGYRRLLARKDGTKRRQPFEDYEPSTVLHVVELPQAARGMA